MAKKEFVHLHQHTHYSLLDGHAKVSPAVQSAVDDGQKGLAITDHGNLYGAPSFYKECKQQGVNPIVGMEAYSAKTTVDEKPSRSKKKQADGEDNDSVDGKAYYHQLLFAKDYAGLQSLTKLSSRSFNEGWHYKPRIDLAMLQDHSEGLMATSSCLGGVVLQEIMNGRPRDAMNYASAMKDIFGEDYYIEVQNHGIQEQYDTNPVLLQIAKRLDIKAIATNDSHYVHQEDSHFHDALLCVQTKSKIADTKRFRFHGDQFWLKTADEMAEAFPDNPEVLANTLEINEKANLIMPGKVSGLPHFPVPDRYQNEEEYLRALARGGAKKRYANSTISGEKVSARLEYELDVICEMGFESYFLIYWDLIKWAHSQGILVGFGRGSAAGCLVAYCLNITKIDPIDRHELIFERFLNPSRVSMPDIDTDFESARRPEIIEYLKNKYGDDRVMQAITFDYIRAKAAIRNSARVQDYGYMEGEVLNKAFPPALFGRAATIEEVMNQDAGNQHAYDAGKDFRALVNSSETNQKILGVARGMEGTVSVDSIHPSAVIMSDKRLDDVSPTQRKKNGPLVSQWEQDVLEDLGLLKLDILGLKNLDILGRCMAAVKADGLDCPDIYDTGNELDDEATYQLLAAGNTVGVFQLESPNMRALLKRLIPSNIDDISATVALYRPGPMSMDYHNIFADRKNERVPVTSLHSELDELLAKTYQLPVYQEQVMFISQKVAGFSLAEADNLRKAMGKKDKKLLDSFKEGFLAGAAANGFDDEFSRSLFESLEEYASYAFNESHSVSYSYLSYWTASFKANFTGQFMAALMDFASDQKALQPLLAECKRMGISILTPSIQSKFNNFTYNSENNGIHFPLSSIKEVGSRGDEIADRAPYDSISDFTSRVALNVNQFQAIAYAGGFDLISDLNRETLVGNADTFVKHGRTKIKDEESGVMSLFEQDLEPTVTYFEEADEAELPNKEKEYLGMFLSGHPVSGFESISELYIADIVENEYLGTFTVAVYLSSVEKFTTRKGREMAKAFVEDTTGSMEVVIFPDTYANLRDHLEAGRVYDMTLKVSARNGDTTFSVDFMDVLD